MRRNAFPYRRKTTKTIRIAIAITKIVMKVFLRPTFATQGDNAKINAVLKLLRVSVTPTSASPTI